MTPPLAEAQRVGSILWRKAIVPSSTVILTVLPQIKKNNKKTPNNQLLTPKQDNILPNTPFSFRDFRLLSTTFNVLPLCFFTNFTVLWKLLSTDSAVLPPSETTQLSSTPRTANLIILYTLRTEAENAIPCCFTALKSIIGFCTQKPRRCDVSNRFCIQLVTNRIPSSQNTSFHSNALRVMTRAENMTDKNQNGCQWDYSMHMNPYQPHSIWLNYPELTVRTFTKLFKLNNKI